MAQEAVDGGRHRLVRFDAGTQPCLVVGYVVLVDERADHVKALGESLLAGDVS